MKNRVKAIILITALCTCILAGCAVHAVTAGNRPLTHEKTIALSSPVRNYTDTTVPDKLLAFRFDGYENMSISEYRAKVIGIIAENEAEYLSLIEHASIDSEIQNIRYTNADAYFVANILIPTIAEKWETWRLNNFCTGDNCTAEYTVSYAILDADNLTMGEKNRAITDIMDSIQELLDTRTSEQLADEAVTQTVLDTKVNDLADQFSNDSFRIEVDLSYRAEAATSSELPGGQMPLEERGEVGTEVDYRLLLSLKTDDYADKSVSDFLHSYTELAQNSDFEKAYERVSRDIASNDVRVDITNEEMRFIETTLEATSQEFVAMYQHGNEPPTLRYRIEKQRCVTINEGDLRDPIVFELFIDYSFVYSIQDDTGLTVGERDTVLLAANNDIHSFIDGCAEAELVNGQAALDTEFERLEQRYSNGKIKLSIDVISYQAHDQNVDVQVLQ